MPPFDDHFDRAHHRHDRAQFKLFEKLEAAARRGWGPGGPGRGWGDWGDWGGFGDNMRVGRMLASGDLRLVALYFIEQQPRHGYDLIKAIEEKTGGIYSPSPGVIYPALTFLEEANFVTSTAEGNKRLYTITDEGRAHLDDNRTGVEATLDNLGRFGERARHMRERWEEAQRRHDEHRGPPPPPPHHRHDRRGPPPPPHHQDRDLHDVAPEVNDARRELKDAIRHAAHHGDPESQRQLAEILRRAADEIRAIEPPEPPHDDVDI